jgi:hypothetical protein
VIFSVFLINCSIKNYSEHQTTCISQTSTVSNSKLQPGTFRETETLKMEFELEKQSENEGEKAGNLVESSLNLPPLFQKSKQK